MREEGRDERKGKERLKMEEKPLKVKRGDARVRTDVPMKNPSGSSNHELPDPVPAAGQVSGRRLEPAPGQRTRVLFATAAAAAAAHSIAKDNRSRPSWGRCPTRGPVPQGRPYLGRTRRKEGRMEEFLHPHMAIPPTLGSSDRD